MQFIITDILRLCLIRETEEELGIPMSQIDVWCQMPELSSSRQGEYVATPVVAQIRNFDEDKLRPSQGEVASVFTGVQRYFRRCPKKVGLVGNCH